MCGIAGVFHHDALRPVNPDMVRAMVDTLVHRGPDGEGFHTRGPIGLGMRRLAVIDLQTGDQPVANEDRTVWVVLNGEIYNFRELRDDLSARGHRFRGQSDTEVLVHLYEECGERLVERLNGMFAFALWDEPRRRLLLARDRLGVKPLYHACLPDRVVFGSEIKALLPAGIPRDLDRQALHHYLSLGYIPAPWSIFRAVRKLEAGHFLLIHDGEVIDRTYWDVPTGEEDPRAVEGGRRDRLQRDMRDLLTDAVRSRLVSDVPIGTFLSGGLDSSTIVALLGAVPAGPGRGPHSTFSVGFAKRSHDELPAARRIAARFGTQHHERVVQMEVSEVLPVLLRQFDEPFADPSAIPTYCVSRMARDHVTVALGGDGGDELFAGYYTYQADRLLSLYRWLPPYLRATLLPRVVSWLRPSGRKVGWEFKLARFVYGGQFEPDRAHFAWKEWFTEDMKRSLYAAPEAGLEPTFSVFERHYARCRSRDWLNRHLYVDTKVYLADDILVKVDRMSMAVSLEVRGPLLDYRLVEAMARLPGSVKMPGLAQKHFLKAMMREDLSRATLSGRKQGFDGPFGRWLEHDLRDVVEDLLSPTALRRQGLFDPEMVSRLRREHAEGRRDWSRNLWILLMFMGWFRQYGGTAEQG